MTWCRYHCRRCESHFTSLEAFDAHHGSEPGTFPDGIDFVETVEPAGSETQPVRSPAPSTARRGRSGLLNYFHPVNGSQTARAKPKRPRMEVAGTS